jgi:hypothetical protein
MGGKLGLTTSTRMAQGHCLGRNPMRASHNLHQAPDLCVLHEMGDELVRRASIANDKHVLAPEVKVVVPICAVEYGTAKTLNLANVVGTVRRTTEAHGGDQKPRVLDVATVRPPVNKMDAPEKLVIEPSCRSALLIQMHLVG